MSRRFMWFGVIAYSGILASVAALALLILGFGRVGQCSTVDNTWEACQFRTDLLASLIIPPLLVSVLTACLAIGIRRQPGEKGRWLAASALIVAPLLLGLVMLGALSLGIQ